VTRRRQPTRTFGLLLGLCAATLGCAAGGAARPAAPFRFERDSFAFPNETVLEYLIDPVTGHTEWRKREPTPEFSLRCGAMARAARQFHLQARFAPERPAPDAATLATLVSEVLARDPRAETPAAEPVVIPGYAGLRSLSAEHKDLFREAIGGVWRTRLQRGNWRMIFPFPPNQQRDEAERLAAALRRGETPIIHVLRFPELTLNHMVLLYGIEETPEELRFVAYDPNEAAAPIVVRWDRAARTFVYPRTLYFGGGPVRAYAIYNGLLS